MHTETPMSAEPVLRTASLPADDRRPVTPRGGAAAGLGAEVIGELETMRRFLETNRPSSGNEALRLLRAAFPDTPLDLRVKAAADRGPAF